jgi:hypothetical protein
LSNFSGTVEVFPNGSEFTPTVKYNTYLKAEWAPNDYYTLAANYTGAVQTYYVSRVWTSSVGNVLAFSRKIQDVANNNAVLGSMFQTQNTNQKLFRVFFTYQ